MEKGLLHKAQEIERLSEEIAKKRNKVKAMANKWLLDFPDIPVHCIYDGEHINDILTSSLDEAREIKDVRLKAEALKIGEEMVTLVEYRFSFIHEKDVGIVRDFEKLDQLETRIDALWHEDRDIQDELLIQRDRERRERETEERERGISNSEERRHRKKKIKRNPLYWLAIVWRSIFVIPLLILTLPVIMIINRRTADKFADWLDDTWYFKIMNAIAPPPVRWFKDID